MNEEEYQPQYFQDGGWQRLVLCEKEWLARPDGWGIDLLPETIRERKERLYYAHLIRAMFDQGYWPFLQEIKAVLLEDDSVPAVDSWEVISQIQSSFAASIGPAETHFFRYFSLYCRGVLTAAELRNKIIGCLFEAAELATRPSSYREKSFIPITRRLASDIVGNPYRPVALDPRWLTSTVVDLAHAVYDDRAWDRMPILADALMDAGCESDDIITHCRGDGPHVRGCWVVDLLLAKS